MPNNLNDLEDADQFRGQRHNIGPVQIGSHQVSAEYWDAGGWDPEFDIYIDGTILYEIANLGDGTLGDYLDELRQLYPDEYEKHFHSLYASHYTEKMADMLFDILQNQTVTESSEYDDLEDADEFQKVKLVATIDHPDRGLVQWDITPAEAAELATAHGITLLENDFEQMMPEDEILLPGTNRHYECTICRVDL